jgi:hypothetical protein
VLQTCYKVGTRAVCMNMFARMPQGVRLQECHKNFTGLSQVVTCSALEAAAASASFEGLYSPECYIRVL